MSGIAARNEELFSSDAHGNTDAGYDGTSVKRYTYDAYGNAIRDNGEDDNPYRYCGENYDEETGLYYLRARYYDPSIGRFMSEDPAQDGLNWYVYCGNNPVMFVDPSGERWEDWSWGFQKPEIRGLVFGQRSNTVVKDLLFYNSKIADVGCEIIAIHNALFLQNDYGENFIDIMNSCRDISYFPNTGVAGCQPNDIGKILDEYSASYYHTTSYDDMCHNLYFDSINIISFWNDMEGFCNPLDGLHTICFTIGETGKVTAYNVQVYQNSYRFYDDVGDFLDDVIPNTERFIVYYGDIYYE